ncbi:hypothetical protein I204_04945 [Kwoniella mangroviensis CBS 8886]|nr:hypothetical protein I204_04945 [Kwoniella mangroviensis CBS 8886]
MPQEERPPGVQTKATPPTPARRPSYPPTPPTPTSIELPLPIQPKDLIEPTIETIITLWRAWPLDWSVVRQGMALQHLTELLDGHWKNISLLDKSVTRGITSPIETVKKNKDTCKAGTIQENVKVAMKLNEQATEEFQLGRYPKSLTTYLQGLAVLCPWSCDDSIMTFDLAKNAELSNIEQQLLLNIARAALAWSLLLPDTRQNKLLCPILVDSTLQAFELFPYITFEGLIQVSDRKLMSTGNIDCVIGELMSASVQHECIT